MQSLQKQFHDFIHTNLLVNSNEKVLLAVSGGMDSMVMAHLFLESNYPFAIAHCNFGLRGDESDGDEAFVMKWAEDHKVDCHIKRFDVHDGSIQLEARRQRYSWFEELLDENKYGKIATAHHQNDSLETVLINLSRGTGIKGLAGIPVRNSTIIRPILFADRKGIENYAVTEGVKWREDSSNKKTEYARNRIRHHVIPELQRLNPSLFKTHVFTSERISFAADIVRERVEEVQKKHLIERKFGYQLNAEWIRSPSDVLILAEILSVYGFNYATSGEIFEARGLSGKSFPGSNWEVTVDRDCLMIEELTEQKELSLLLEDYGSFKIGDKEIIVEEVGLEEVLFEDDLIAFFDAEKLSFPMEVRSWREGDRFQPLGMFGEKKISDYLIDTKVSLVDKKEVLVLKTSDGIAWVIGKRISEAYKVSSKTGRVIKITFSDRDS